MARSPQGQQTPAEDPPVKPPAPGMALRTYRFLRFGVLAVIAALAVSLVYEGIDTGCLQGSISAYYYTDARSIFVGALVAIGLVMIALWGKSFAEDGFLNLAGLLAPVVAFVPTTETADIRKCAITTSTGGEVTSDTVEADIVETASHGAVDNNMLAYMVVVGIVLVAVGIRGWYGRKEKDPAVVDHPRAYWVPWGTAMVLWLVGLAIYFLKRDWMYNHTHKPAAVILFVFIVAAVVAVGFYKRDGDNELGDPPSLTWAHRYWWLAGGMTIGAGVVVFLTKVVLPPWWDEHTIFMLEAWMILGLAAFWVAQTIDRWHDGAPPKTKLETDSKKAEVAAMRAELAAKNSAGSDQQA